MKKSLLPIAVVLALCPAGALAQYVVGPSVIAGGGARMTGGGYVITGTTGQSAPVGISDGGSYVTHHGFWHAVTGGGGLSPMALSIELISASTARLSWGAVTGATHYDLYRSTTPFFHASGGAWQIVAHPTTHRDFTGGIGNTATNYFFLGKARNASQTSLESNIVGECDFGADIPRAGFDLSEEGAETRR